MGNDDWKFDFVFLIIIIALIIFSLIGLDYVITKSRKIGFEIGYKEACADFYNGKLKYEPVKKEIIEWKEVKK